MREFRQTAEEEGTRLARERKNWPTIEKVSCLFHAVPDVSEIRRRVVTRRRKTDPLAVRRRRECDHGGVGTQLCAERGEALVQFDARVVDGVPVQVRTGRSRRRGRVGDRIRSRLARKDGFERDPQFLRGYLETLLVQALTHLDPAVSDQDGTVHIDVHEGRALIHRLDAERESELCRHEHQASFPPLVLSVELGDLLLAPFVVRVLLELAHHSRHVVIENLLVVVGLLAFSVKVDLGSPGQERHASSQTSPSKSENEERDSPHFADVINVEVELVRDRLDVIFCDQHSLRGAETPVGSV